MTDARTPPATPRTLLLATDLSSRCDRALDRAASLAARWDARLIVVNVIEASRR
ncbi:MAG: universal stress protein, partial [Brevundimonas sp.]